MRRISARLQGLPPPAEPDPNTEEIIHVAKKSNTSKAKQGRKTISKATLFFLSIDIFIEIFAYLHPKELLKFMATCMQAWRYLDDSSDFGARNWGLIRRKYGFPNPSLVHLTDLQFFKQYYGRGCSFCDSAPRARKVYWQFHSYRLCSGCYTEKLQPDFKLGHIRRCRFQYLPYLHCGYPDQYQLFWFEDILDHDPSKEEIAQLCQDRANFSKFANLMSQAEYHLAAEKAYRENEVFQRKKLQVDTFLASTFPEKAKLDLQSLRSYNSAINSAVPLSNKGMSKRLFNSVTKELAERKISDAKARFQSDLLYHFDYQQRRDICTSSLFLEKRELAGRDADSDAKTLEVLVGHFKARIIYTDFIKNSLPEPLHSFLPSSSTYQIGKAKVEVSDMDNNFERFSNTIAVISEELLLQKLKQDLNLHLRAFKGIPFQDISEFKNDDSLSIPLQIGLYEAVIAKATKELKRRDHQRQFEQLILSQLPLELNQFLSQSLLYQSTKENITDETPIISNSIYDTIRSELKQKQVARCARLLNVLGESVSHQAITQRMLYCSRCNYCSSQGATLHFMNNHLTNSRLCDPSFVAVLPQYSLQATKVSDA
jgi:hypothetical protein